MGFKGSADRKVRWIQVRVQDVSVNGFPTCVDRTVEDENSVPRLQLQPHPRFCRDLHCDSRDGVLITDIADDNVPVEHRRFS